MENKYIYIDESGDTGYTKKSTRYFILTAVIVDDPFVLRRIAKATHSYNLDKKKLGIIHTNKESSSVKNKLIKYINNAEIKCVTCVFYKNNFKVKDIYKYCLDILAKYFVENNMENIVIARKDIRKAYNLKIIEMYLSYKLKASFSDQNREKSLQIADFYSWCIFSHYEHNLSEYFLKLKDSITIIKTKLPTGL